MVSGTNDEVVYSVVQLRCGRFVVCDVIHLQFFTPLQKTSLIRSTDETLLQEVHSHDETSLYQVHSHEETLLYQVHSHDETLFH